MAAKSAKGIKICITTGGVAGAALTPTAISKAKPAVVSLTGHGVQNGDLVMVTKSGFPELDGKAWVASAVATGTFSLLGSDTTGSSGTLASGGLDVKHFAESAFTCLCLSSFGYNPEAPGSVSVGTYCQPGATLASAAASAGTFDFAGYVDINDADYAELLKAVEDGNQRYLRIMLPSNGYLVAPVTFASINYDLPLDGAVAYSGTGAMGARLRHIF